MKLREGEINAAQSASVSQICKIRLKAHEQKSLCFAEQKIEYYLKIAKNPALKKGLK
jgi:hypothetical protein